jgi:hypothetical protein
MKDSDLPPSTPNPFSQPKLKPGENVLLGMRPWGRSLKGSKPPTQNETVFGSMKASQSQPTAEDFALLAEWAGNQRSPEPEDD